MVLYGRDTRIRNAHGAPMKRLSPTQEAMLRDMVEDPSLDFSVNGPVQSTLQALRRLNYVWLSNGGFLPTAWANRHVDPGTLEDV
jgi:hypothetical protein